jgi:uncharacterized protein (TIGR03435 family)
MALDIVSSSYFAGESMGLRNNCIRLGVLLAGLACVAAVAQEKRPSYDVATVKPAKPDAQGWSWNSDRSMTTMQNIPLMELLRNAYGMKTLQQVVGVPDWVRDAHYDITAKVDDEEFRRTQTMDEMAELQEHQALLQGLLADRFGLRVKQETRKLPAYALVVDEAGAGSGLKPTANDTKGRHANTNNGHMVVSGVSMNDFAEILSGKNEVGQRVVLNQTGLNGRFDFTLDYAPDSGAGVATDATRAGLLQAVHEQLGLRVKKIETDVPVVIVEMVNKPEFD